MTPDNPRPRKLDVIYTEDCLETMASMADNSVDIVFTSPPYNRKRNDVYSHYDDIITDYLEFLISFTDECMRVSERVIVNIQANYYNKVDVYKYIGHYADKIANTIVWTKANPMPAQGNNMTNSFEYFIVFGKPLKSNTTYTKNHIHTAVNPDTKKAHGAIMNLVVAEWFIDKFTQKGDVVYDPFMGLGTTAIACKKLGRHYIGSEISADYSSMAEERIKEKSMIQMPIEL